jgi:membrane fusion protein (multidrug efflux system)
MKIKPSVILIILIIAIVAYNLANRIWLEEWRAKRAAEKSEQTEAPGRGGGGGGRGGGGGGSIPADYMILKSKSFDEVIRPIGTLLANEQADLRSEASGKITEINFSEGTKVRKGDLLVKINDKDLQAQYQRAIHRQKLAEERERRQQVLFGRDAISREEYDVALTELNSLKAETDLIRAQIERTEIRAPFDGVVGLRSVSVGEFISSQITVARLVNNDPIKLDFSVPQRYFDVVHINSRVNFTVDGDNNIYTATVYAIEPRIDLATRTIHMRAKAPNPQGRLFPGSSAQMSLVLTALTNAIMVPAQALVSEAEGHKAYIYKDGRASQVDVVVGTRTERDAHIIRGLEIGDTLIVSGILQLRHNAGVRLSTEVK